MYFPIDQFGVKRGFTRLGYFPIAATEVNYLYSPIDLYFYFPIAAAEGHSSYFPRAFSYGQNEGGKEYSSTNGLFREQPSSRDSLGLPAFIQHIGHPGAAKRAGKRALITGEHS